MLQNRAASQLETKKVALNSRGKEAEAFENGEPMTQRRDKEIFKLNKN